MHWSQFRGSLLKSAQNLGIRIISIIWINSVIKLISYLKQCHLYKLVHGLSILPNSPLTTSSSHSYPTCSNHNILYMCPPPTQMLIITPFFVMPYVPGTHYLTLLRRYLTLIYLKRLYLVIVVFVLYCFLLLGTYSVFRHKLLYTKKSSLSVDISRSHSLRLGKTKSTVVFDCPLFSR